MFHKAWNPPIQIMLMPFMYSSSFSFPSSPAENLTYMYVGMSACMSSRPVLNPPVFPAEADISLHQGHKMIDTPTSCASGTRVTAWVRTTLYITSDQYPTESNLQSSPVKPTQHAAQWANQPAETTWHYFKIFVEKVQQLGGTFKASAGVRPREILQTFPQYLLRDEILK